MASEHKFSSEYCLAVCTQTLGAYYDSLISFTLSPRYSTFVSCNKYIYICLTWCRRARNLPVLPAGVPHDRLGTYNADTEYESAVAI
jgi:hypothetical protein